VIEPDHFGVTLPLRIGPPDDPAVVAAREQLETRLPETERGELAGAFAVGPPSEVIAILKRHVAAGMSKFVVLPIAHDAPDLLDQTAMLTRHILPAIEATG
jgi:hypothetical protein